MNFDYIIALFLLCIAYGVCIYFMKYMRATKLTNIIFGCFVFIPYLWLAYIVYSDVGFYDWNFQNVLPVANVSPFMFCTVPLLIVLPKHVKKHVFLLISLLSVGMFGSSVLGCINNAAINYKFHFHFLLDYISHFSLSLFGIYLIKSRQVSVSLKNSAISASIIVGSATVMLILNLIFDTSFFGLSLRGKHNIYNNVLVESSILSALLYYFGLALVLALGFLLCKMLDNKESIIDDKKRQ